MEDLPADILESQALIDQATGVLMATEERSSAEALDRLRDLALGSGESMRTVATWVLDERPTSAPLLEQEETIRRDDP